MGYKNQYIVEQSGKDGQFFVVNLENNDTSGGYATREEAQAQIAAIEANEEKDANKDMYASVPAMRVPLPQNIVKYTPMSQTPGEMCAGCWFYSGENECQIVSGYPQRIVATGWCDKFLNDRDIIMQIPEVAELVSKHLSTIDKVKNWLNKPQEVTEHGVFKALGDGKWMAAYTNDFEDREKEIIERAGHDRFIQRLKAGLVPMPELWVWHTKGTRIGEALDIDRYGHIVVAIGQFDATPIAKEAEKNLIKTGTKDIRLSHGFKYPLWAFKNGIYSDLNTFEITLLPEGAEANPYTAFDLVVKENSMPVSDNKRTFLGRIFGEKAPEVIGHIEGMENRAKAVEDMGTRYKDVTDLTPPQTETPNETPTSDEDQKLFSDMILDFVTDVNNMYGLLKSIDAARQADKAEVAELKKELKAATEALNTQTKALQSERELAPRSVQQSDNAGAVVPANDPDAAKAKEELDGQEKGGSDAARYARMFGGLNTPENGSTPR